MALKNETWLRPDDNLSFPIIAPPSYSLLQEPRPNGNG